MELADIQSVLGFLTGSIQTANPKISDQLEQAQLRMGKVLIQNNEQELPILKSIPVRELYQPTSEKLNLLEKVTASLKNNGATTEEEIFFIRNTDNIHSLINTSQPDWARNSSPAQSYGPFQDVDGQTIYIDFYRITKLITLYVGNQPILCFSTTVSPLDNRYSNVFNLKKGSLWVNAKLLNPSAGADQFVGFDIRSGSLNLSTAPTTINSKVTVGAGATIQLSFELSPDSPLNNTPTIALDAKDTVVTFPTTIALKGNTQSLKFTASQKGNFKTYSLNTSFDAAPNQTLRYTPADQTLHAVLNHGANKINAKPNTSKYIQVEGSATVSQMQWIFPLSKININQTPTASNNFYIKALISEGIAINWKHLKYQDFLLKKPELLAKTSNLLWRDSEAYGLEGSSYFKLWNNQPNQNRSSIAIQYAAKQPLYFLSDGMQDFEQISTIANTKSEFDRPISVRNTAFNFNSKNSNIFFAVKSDGIHFSLIDLDLLEDDPMAKNRIEAIALHNALFKVSNIRQCLMMGKIHEDSDQVEFMNAFLIYSLHMYLPTLPDPYISNTVSWERGRLYGFNNNKPLIFHIQINNGGKENENLDTKFYFGSLPTSQDLEYDEDPAPQPSPTQPKDPKDSKEIKEPTQPQKSIQTGKITIPGRNILINEPIKNVIKGATLKKNILAQDFRIINEVKLQPIATNNKTTITQIAKIWKELQPRPKVDNSPTLNFSNPDNIPRSIKEIEKTKDFDGLYEQDVIGNKLSNEFFSLLDVSSNAYQMGVSLSGEQMFIPKSKIKDKGNGEYEVIQANDMSFKVDGMDVQFEQDRIRQFLLPQHAWEPVYNLSAIQPVREMDPPVGYNYFANNGGPSRILNNNKKYIPLTPNDNIDALIQDYKTNSSNFTLAAFTLPFGKRAVSILYKNGIETVKPTMENLRPKFRKQNDGSFYFEGGHQLSLKAGNHGINNKFDGIPPDSNMFPGFAYQSNNYVNHLGDATGDSHLSDFVTKTFNQEFFTKFLQSPDLKICRGVPVTRIDLTGYGANMLSNWVSPAAALNEVSQTRFDTFHGRTSHEVIQVKSMIYPWGIRVVRTITTYRTKNGLIHREDSGWQCESDGMFNFRVKGMNHDQYNFHPGLMHGIVDIQNIRETLEIPSFTQLGVKLDPVYFDGNVILENVQSGGKNNKVPAKKILGYLHNQPQGELIEPNVLAQLILSQPTQSIGGALDCEINLNQSEQYTRVFRFDINVGRDTSNNINFVGALRGNVILPNDGSWTVVEHNAATGEVFPVNAHQGVSFIRAGVWVAGALSSAVNLAKELVKMSPPEQLLLNYTNYQRNFGLLQNTNTQKVLFLAPVFEKSRKAVLSRVQPLYADAHRLMKSSGIFTNIGDAITNYGAALLLEKGRNEANQIIDAFKKLNLQDGGKEIFEVIAIEVKKEGEKIVEKGIRLAKNVVNDTLDKAFKFDLPEGAFYIVDEDMFKLYVEYVAPETQPVDYDKYYGKTLLDYDFDSLKNDFTDQWRARLSNVAMVIDLANFKRLVSIKANFNAQKGENANFGGSKNAIGLPRPEITFSKDLEPVMDILRVLSQLSGGNYDEIIKSGLKIAMSNSSEVWSYKYEIDKSIPLIRFPAQDALYNNPTTPLKLECGLTLGAYFNAALKINNGSPQLVPSAGAYLGFNGGIEVLCTSVGAGSLYAIGKVALKISADSSGSVGLQMSFGFGISIAVGFPVVGTANVSFIAGVEITVENKVVTCVAIMVFKGNASLVGGLVTVTIMIEAKGGVRIDNGKTECQAQVTFALDISIFLVIDISFSKTWGEDRQIA